MATLTWQDVAGQVRAPDLNGSALLISRGVDQLAAAAQEPERIRQAQIDREMKGLLLQSEMAGRTDDMLDKRDTKRTAAAEKADMKEFGAAQSTLEAMSRSAGLKGSSYDDVLKSDAYMGLSPGARAYASAHLSDAWTRGDEARLAKIEGDQDEARAQANFNRSFAQSEQHHRDSEARQTREFNRREKLFEEEYRAKREAEGFISNDPKTNIAWRERSKQTASQKAPILRGLELYGNMSPREAAIKGKNDGNWFRDGDAEAQVMARNVQEKTGKKVDTWMINQLLVEGGSANNGFLNPRGQFDQGKAEEYLTDLVKLNEAANKNQEFFDAMTINARNGTKYDVNSDGWKKHPIQLGVDSPKSKESTRSDPDSAYDRMLESNIYMR